MMPDNFRNSGWPASFPVGRLALMLLLALVRFSAAGQTITNLQQLTGVAESKHRTHCSVQLEVTVCAASRPAVGVLIVQDETGVELLELGNWGREIFPGEKIRIQGTDDLLREREMGVELTASPAVDNDGMHFRMPLAANAALKAGLIPLRLDWFNCLRNCNLEVSGALTNEPEKNILSPTNLWHAVVDDSGHTNFLPGLRAEYYEGYWEAVPNFDLLQPVKTGVVSNFDLGFTNRNEIAGIRFTGYWRVSQAGEYQLRLSSETGSLLFLNQSGLTSVPAGTAPVPVPQPGFYGERMERLNERRWMTLTGRVSFVSKNGRGIEFDLRSDRDVIPVKVADADGLDLTRLQGAFVQVTGVSGAVLTSDQRLVLGKLFAAGAEEIRFIDRLSGEEPALPIKSVRQVQNLPVEAARRSLPVHIHGVVTDVKNDAYDHWMSLQDDTRGIFVRLGMVTNSYPVFGESLEVEGHSGIGDFAPIVIADKIIFLGDGRLPQPAHPTWTELLNGSMDVQWVELQGLVTDVDSNQITLLLPEGRLEVQMDGYFEPELKPFLKTVVHIRGVLYAVWNATSREVRVGSVMMRNANISMDAAAPADPFVAVSKTPRELLLFDEQATPFRRVKVHGQIIYADAMQIYLEQDGAGLRLVSADKTEVHPGDVVDAVGYPDIGRKTLLLREVQLRKTGSAPLPAAKKISESELMNEDLDSTWVRVDGKLLGWHMEQGIQVLEMQSGANLYLARPASEIFPQLSLRTGSRLALEGVYVAQGRSSQLGKEAGSFELLLNSPANIVVLSQPSWWTLQRMLILIGVLLSVLIFTVIWITQLQRLVEQRTGQLQREIREREHAERQHALEAERSRIARDLHDDLGSSLTEIGVLASTGQRLDADEDRYLKLFRAIAGKARGLIAALDVIVWAVDPEDNSLQSLADYLSGFTGEFFSHSDIICRFKVPVTFPSITLDGQVRHELLMAVKETLNNVVRHSDAATVEFRMAMTEDMLEIVVADDGKGFDDSTGKDGHGLKNLSVRLKKIGGSCLVKSSVGQGTLVTICLALSPPDKTKIRDSKICNTTFD